MSEVKAKYTSVGFIRGIRFGQVDLSRLSSGGIKTREVDLSGTLGFCNGCKERSAGACDGMSFYCIGENIYTSAQTHAKPSDGHAPACTRRQDIKLHRK